MCGKDEHFGNLHVGRGLGGIEAHIGNIVAGEWLDAIVDVIRPLLVTMKARHAEVGFYKTRLHWHNTHCR